jgi:hypothetical protein
MGVGTAVNSGQDAMANAVLQRLGKMLSGQQGPKNAAPTMSRQAAMQDLMRKEAILAKHLATPQGLRKIAANMANPVRFRLDYAGIGRKFVIVEQMPDGVPLIFDKDLPFVPAVKVGKGGAPRMIEMRGKRVQLESFEIAARTKIPYEELYTRRYRALERAKDRLIEGMELREDLILFGLLETASGIANVPVGTSGKLEKETLAKGYAQIEDNRLVVSSVLMSAFGTASMRRWIFQDIDQLGLQELRETGYLGSIWGADFYVSDQIPDGTVYLMTSPKFLGWMPIRKDTDVIPADDPDNLRLGFTGYELIGLTIFNALGVEKVTFNPNV